MSFVNLHVHDAKGSLLDSILTVPQLVKFAKDNGQGAIALTNHGYMFSYVDFVKECNKHGVKPIIGNEIYEVDDMWEMNDTKEHTQPRYHLILLAKNQIGFQNLIDITSIACTEGFYKKPRIDLNYIKNHNWGEGIICLTACQAGRLSRLLVHDQFDKAKNWYNKLANTFDHVFVEIQSHGTESQKEANKKIIEFANNNNLQYVITTDAHMLNESVADSHAVFVAIGEGREVGESYSGCWLQTEEMVHDILDNELGYETVQKGIECSQKIADLIEEIDIGLNKGNQMPKIEVSDEWGSHEDYLRHLVYSTFDEKFGHMSKEEQQVRRDRIEEELNVLYQVDYTDYFIIVYQVMKEARKRGIALGYGRGSAAGCLCLYMLNVTQIDSVRFDLDFSRFASVGRKSMADIDIDISKRRRREMVEICEELFGKENVAPICTFNTLSTKVAINDIGKVLNEDPNSPYYNQIPYSLRDEVRKMIPTIKTLNDLGEEEEKSLLLKDLLSSNPKLSDVYDQFPLWFKYVMDVEGLPKSLGRHAAGTLITPRRITSYCPLCLDTEKAPMTQLEMHAAMDTGEDGLSLLKLDLLGLSSLDVISDTLNMCGLTWDDVDINRLNLDDQVVFDDVYRKGNTEGIFQFVSQEARSMTMEVGADTINDIVAVNAANRPATKDFFPEYVKNKFHPEDAQLIHEDLKKLFASTHGVMLYQEQALSLLRYAGFPDSEVDVARRAISKKQADKMAKMKPAFVSGLIEKGWTKQQANDMWDLMEKQSSYSFNKCLTGDTIVYRSSGCLRDIEFPQRGIPIQAVYERFNAKSAVGQKYRSGNANRGLFIYGLDNDGRARAHKVKHIYFQGVQPVWKITLENGNSIKATANHRFYTSDGVYKTVDILTTQDSLWCCDYEYEIHKKRYALTPVCEKCGETKRARGKHYEGMGFQSGEANPAYVNGSYVKFQTYHDSSNGICELCGQVADRIETHHIDGDRYNNEPENLINLCVSCHKKEHYKMGRTKRGEKGYPTYASQIVSIKYVGEEETYDLEMDSEEHNFFANGICSHNSHAVCYSLLSYLMAYLKVHYPLQFMAALLTDKSDKVEKLSPIITDCNRMGIKVVPPNVNKSAKEFTPNPAKNEILFGLLAVKGLGESIINKIIENRPYNSLKDFFEKVQDKTAIITLIKAGALPVRDKKKALQTYAKSLFNYKSYKPVQSLPTYKSLLVTWGLDKDDYLLPSETKRQKVDKERLLEDYNKLKEQKYLEEQKAKYKKHMTDFYTKYAQDEYLWEFDTLSMFLTNDPLESAYKYITYRWDDVVENTETTILCVITDIKRKKDKHGNQFAYIDLYTPDGIIEGTIWSRQLKDYFDLIKKGNCVAMLGRKNEDHFFVSKVKAYKQWVVDRGLGRDF